jgi:hypothetical protein
MLKRYIFFFCYIFFFTAVPFGVYYLWPVADSGQHEMMAEGGAFGKSPQSGMQDSGLTNEEMVEMNTFSNSMNDTLAEIGRVVRVTYAILVCFIVSILFALVLSIVKCAMPELKFGGLLTGITIFNFLYLPAVFIIVTLNIKIASTLYLVAMYIFSKPGLFVLAILAIVFLATILFTVLGVVRRIKRENQKLTQEMPQTFQSSQPPQF